MNRLRQLKYEPSKHDLETQFAMGRLMSPAEVAAAKGRLQKRALATC